VKAPLTLVGIAIVAGHAAAFVHFADRARGSELAVEVPAPLAAPELALVGTVPAGIAHRVTHDLRDATGGPGLAHARWTTAYRGGFARTVGATQLVGPFQDPAAEACSGRVIVGQDLLDKGEQSIVAHMQKMIDAEMRGLEIFALGSFEKVSGVSLQWAQLAKHPEDKHLLPAGTDGYVRVTARVSFERVDIPLVVALVPIVWGGELKFTLFTQAKVEFGNRALDWVSDKVGADKLATKLAARELDRSLITTLAPPPPFDIVTQGEPTQRLEFTYCDKAPEIVERSHAALPFAVKIGTVAGDPTILPPRLGAAPHAPVPPGTIVALDLDLDALNATLFELWRTGYLDRRLAEVGLDRSFNADELVTQYLSIRISPVRLALPPVVRATPTGLELAADGRVAIADGAATTVGRVWGGLALKFTQAVGDKTSLGASVDLHALELSCERTKTTLVPCYADLVGAIAGRTSEFHGVLTTAFVKLLTDIFVDQRVGASGMPADLVIRGVVPTITAAGANASMRLTFDATLAPTK